MPAGWYRDPQYPSVQRYWDGWSWTEHAAPAPMETAVIATRRDDKKVLIWILAIALVAVTIGALYATFVLPGSDTQRKYQTVSVVSDMAMVAIALESYHATYKSYPSTLRELTSANAVPRLRLSGINVIAVTTDGLNGFCITGMNQYSDYNYLSKMYDSVAGGFKMKGTPCSQNYKYSYQVNVQDTFQSSPPVAVRFGG